MAARDCRAFFLSDLAVMACFPFWRVPRFIARINETATRSLTNRPMSCADRRADFTHRVARRVRKLGANSDHPLCDPSVGRGVRGARRCELYRPCSAVLPFEPEALARLADRLAICRHPLIEHLDALTARPGEQSPTPVADPAGVASCECGHDAGLRRGGGAARARAPVSKWRCRSCRMSSGGARGARAMAG